LDEVAHRVLLAGGDDIALRVVLLEHEPLHAHVVAGVAPIALGVEVAEIQVLPWGELDAGARGGSCG
jgi:hypothetical protein